MSKAKYKEYIEKMYDENQLLFSEFKSIHDQFMNGNVAMKAIFHGKGKVVLDIVRDWERRLCRNMGKGQYSQYAVKLSEKFWQEIEKDYPLIQKVGIKSNFD